MTTGRLLLIDATTLPMARHAAAPSMPRDAWPRHACAGAHGTIAGPQSVIDQPVEEVADRDIAIRTNATLAALRPFPPL